VQAGWFKSSWMQFTAASKPEDDFPKSARPSIIVISQLKMQSFQRRKFRWVVLGVATIAQATACFLVQGLGALSSHLQAALELNAFEIGLLVSAAQIVPVLGLLVAGELLDRFNERQIVGIGTLLVAVSLWRASLATSYGNLLVWLTLTGLGYSTAQPGGSKSVSGWFSKPQRGFAMGIRQAGLPLGGAIAAASLPLIATNYGWQAAFQVGAGVALAGAVLFILVYRSPTENLVSSPAPQANVPSTLRDRLALLRLPQMRNSVCSGISLISAQYGIVIFLALYLHERFSTSIETSVMMLFIAQEAGVVGRIILARWSDRSQQGRFFPVLVSSVAVLLGLMLLLVPPTDSFMGLAVLSTWLGFFGFGWYGLWVTYVSESALPLREGFTLGLAMAINQVAVIGSPPLLGWLRDATGSYTASWLLLIVMLLAALLIVLDR
jgi:sugar phosphate permease